MVASLQETLARHVYVRGRLQQLQPRLGITERNPHELLKEPVILVSASNAVSVQMEDGVLLRLGPQTFTAHISPQGGEGIQGKQQDEKLNAYQQRHCADCEVQLAGDGDIPEPPIEKEPVRPLAWDLCHSDWSRSQMRRSIAGDCEDLLRRIRDDNMDVLCWLRSLPTLDDGYAAPLVFCLSSTRARVSPPLGRRRCLCLASHLANGPATYSCITVGSSGQGVIWRTRVVSRPNARLFLHEAASVSLSAAAAGVHCHCEAISFDEANSRWGLLPGSRRDCCARNDGTRVSSFPDAEY